ncbi:CatA-like O-acetyltransferase [Paenibacillus sp. NRS-1760]|uniref:CatA-like O-acetyltransferase n=1 Tax=unclassified Paenibacillus TaxID=185978 RepID=UPI003D29B238
MRLTIKCIQQKVVSSCGYLYSRYLDDIKKYGNVKQFAAKTNNPPGTFPISSIPWVSFTGFNLNIYNEGTYLLPIFTMGKYFQHDEKILLPLSGQFHHAVCDGYHAGVLYNELHGYQTTRVK